MPYCRSCGAEIPAGAAFCGSCGAAVAGRGAGGAPAGKARATARGAAPRTAARPAARSAVSAAAEEVRSYMMFGLAGLGGLAVLGLLLNNTLGLIVAGALGAAAYFMAFRKLEEGDTGGAKNASLIIGVVIAVIGLAVVFMRDMIGILDIVVSAPFFMVWNALK